MTLALIFHFGGCHFHWRVALKIQKFLIYPFYDVHFVLWLVLFKGYLPERIVKNHKWGKKLPKVGFWTIKKGPRRFWRHFSDPKILADFKTVEISELISKKMELCMLSQIWKLFLDSGLFSRALSYNRGRKRRRGNYWKRSLFLMCTIKTRKK